MDFLNIKTVFIDNSQRNTYYLSSLYKNKQFLYKEIASIIEPYLTKKDIENKKILLKPNWVRHNIKKTDEICLCTNEQFILGTVEYILKQNPKSIVIGDAPIQGCNWERLLSDDFFQEIEKLEKIFSTQIQIKDFRRTTFNFQQNKIYKERNSINNYIIFDLEKNSFLEPISGNEKNLFRVNDYDPDKLTESHKQGTHKYCVTKEIFEADVVITIPKIKTHQKSGFTNALKILVGINGDKDFLPHHRKGGSKDGGDCYPGSNLLRKWAENVIDYSNKNIGKWNFRILRKFVTILWKLSKPSKEHNLGAAWHGNDTVWRMVLDLNQIALYGNKDGTISNIPQRNIFTLCDGIIAGQGNGPLFSEPLELGIISFSNSSYFTDIIIAQLLQMDIDKIPLLKEVQKLYNREKFELKLNDNIIQEEELNKYSIKAQMPPGWLNYKK
jgi:uncharacterized protein (DUF362 family)